MTRAKGPSPNASDETTDLGREFPDRRSTTRRKFLKGVGASIAALGLSSRASAAGQIPTGPTFYQVAIQGATPFGSFSREGLLLVEPPLSTGNVNFNNGVNARDVGLISGNPPGAPEIGAIWFATNTSVYDQMGLNTNIDLSLIDVAFVTANEQADTLTVQMDGQFWGLPAARTALLNCFTPSGGLLANIYQIIQGGMQLQFGNGGQSVAGAISFVGNGYIEPGSSTYEANFGGNAIVL